MQKNGFFGVITNVTHRWSISLLTYQQMMNTCCLHIWWLNELILLLCHLPLDEGPLGGGAIVYH